MTNLEAGSVPIGLQVSFCQAVSVLVSAYTLVAISVDRYLAIMWPLRPRLSGRLSHGAMLLVWVFAVLTALPIPMVTRLTQPDSWHAHCGKWVCLEDWPSPLYRHYYTLALMSLQYFAPLTVLLYTYTKIAIVIWGKRTPGEAENLRDQRLAKAKRKMVTMMITVVAAFTICWLPFNMLVTVWTYNDSLSDQQWLPELYFAFHWLAMSHSCLNPLIYCWMNARFRQSFRSVLRCGSLKRRPAALQHVHATTGAGLTCTSFRSNRKTTYLEDAL
ncbi:RYamide receptor [Frankliniella fusca]|uniref:RYamide receptor n=1 Tax=Frankliniella fusca TaxID=407009 RepID=A0AAE1HD64_9NEOP|nr:RYamide receptor [Frankliniella fusca]